MAGNLGDNVRKYRRVVGLSQEEPAHRAGLGLSTVAKLEQGGTVRIETLHMIARALDVETSDLMVSAGREPIVESDFHSLQVMELRKVLTPPKGFSAPVPADDEVPNLAALRHVIVDFERSYFADDYEEISHRLPDLMRDVNTAVRHYESGPERTHALEARITAMRMAGNYLTQTREYDLAYHALSQSIDDAQEISSDLDIASGVMWLCWMMLRQGRLKETLTLAAETADHIEPNKISTASIDHLSVWGWRSPPTRDAHGTQANSWPPPPCRPTTRLHRSPRSAAT
ncbi:helix-turn-helix domain-containing protein [Embleya sp. NPDC059237]|uniref:helix-turn-helix domain-containing protein n=1 Tax=Embleya sp. NPDC059237 TaxID=3346784 RepID=UPI003691733C